MADYNLTQTGAQVQQLLDTVAAGYIYMGTADLTTTPDTTNPNVCYLLKAVGTYTNFGNVTHSSGITIAKWNGTAWASENVPSAAVVPTDATPTANSTNPVQSGAVFDEIYDDNVTSHSTNNITLTGSWNASFFNEVIPAGSQITGVTGLTGFYFCKQNGSFFGSPINPNITVFPFTLEQDAYGVTANGAQSGTVQYQTTEYINLIEKSQNEIAEIQGKVISTEDVSLTVQGVSSYAEVKFNNVIPKGTIISYFTQTGNGGFYLTDINGNFDSSLTSANIKSQLPYTTTKDYRGIKTQNAFNVTFVFMGNTRIDTARPQIMINTTDTEFVILEKFRYAFMKGNIDVIFQKGNYTLKEIYTFMSSTLGWTWTMGLPVGNGCRYFGNGSTINSVSPSDTSYNNDRNIFDTKASGTSFEMYDFNLILTGGTYCIHDEAQTSEIPYLHKYENVNMSHTGATRCLGVGTGFNANLYIKNCNFIVPSGNPIAIHTPTSNPDSKVITLHLTIEACYMSAGRPFTINSSYVDVNRDDVMVKFVNNSAAAEFDSGTSSAITTLYAFNNVIR